MLTFLFFSFSFSDFLVVGLVWRGRMNHEQPGLVWLHLPFFFLFFKSWAACRTVWEKFRVLPLYLT